MNNLEWLCFRICPLVYICTYSLILISSKVLCFFERICVLQAEKQQKSHSGSPAREVGQGGEEGCEGQEEELADDGEK